MKPIPKNIYQYLLTADGINQPQRFPAALDPASVKIDGRSTSDLLRFIYSIAAQVRYFDTNKVQQGDWQTFFSLLANGSEIFSDAQLDALLAVKKDLSPHLALILAFLKVYSIAKNDLNTLTRKRLDYYYEEVLQLKRKAANPDKVHVQFELGKNAAPVLVKAGTLLDGGKTKTGLPLQYILENEIVVSHATVGMIRSSYQDFNPGGKGIVFRANDASNVVNDTKTGWRPFGSSQLSMPPELRTMEPVSFGWSVASPNFLLAEGKRTIRLTIAMKSFIGVTFPHMILSPFMKVSLTGEKAWLSSELSIQSEIVPAIPFAMQDPTIENLFTLQITASLNETAPAITAYNEKVHMGMYPSVWPVMRMLLKPENYLLETLAKFKIDNVTIEVEAKGVKDLVMQNDLSVQPAGKPVLPFGSIPLVDANFYIGSKEIFSKSLTSLNVKLEWQDPPADFIDYYSGYGNPAIMLQSFTADMYLLSGRNWNVKILPNQTLFNSSGSTLVKEMNATPAMFATQTLNAPFKRDPDLVVPTEFSNTVNQGFVKIVLTGPDGSFPNNLPLDAPFEAFGNKTFATAYTQKVIELSKFVGPPPAPALPKPPYVPTLKSVTLDYTAKDVFRPDAPNTIEQYFIEDVFGPAQTEKNDIVLLLPAKSIKGALYIALDHSTAPQSVSLLFQIEEGSVDSDKLLRSSDLQWSYLAGNHWENIVAPDIVEESTGGLQKPGLIRVNIGADASIEHSLMPRGMRWLRVSVNDNPGGAAAITNIAAQAARGILVLPDSSAAGYEEHLSTPLAPKTIGKLINRVSAIKKVTQPYPSFDGRNPESDDAFYRRVSERLRHKNRAVSGWDYERILLENYPEIYKVKCLPHTDTESFFKPGDVRMVVVPDWRKRPTGDPLQPRVNQNKLREIEDYIGGSFTSPFAKVHVTNPTYETLLVDCRISFHAEFDPGYYSIVLNEELKKFLSPWAYEEGKDIVFGGRVYASEILAFIEGRPYVDFVTEFQLYHRYQGLGIGGIGDMEIGFDFIIGYSPEPTISTTTSVTPLITEGGKAINIDFVIGVPVDIAIATKPDSILVSNSNHRIEALPAGDTSCKGIALIGIGQMIVGLDLIPIS